MQNFENEANACKILFYLLQGSLVRYLVSPAASYITGVNYAVDGGALPVVS